MPFLNMFKSKRSRSTSASPLDRSSDVDGSEFYDQEPMYHRPRASSGLSRSTAVRGTQLHDGSRAQRHGSSFHNSGYPHAPSDDESWYRVDHPRSRQGPYGRDNESYTEDRDRHSDVSGAGVPVHFISESSRVDSPVPTVHRRGSRPHERFPATSSSMPAQTSPPPGSVTRLDLHDDVSENYEGFDRLRRGPSSHSHASRHHPGGHHHSQRRPHQHAYQQNSVQLNPASDSSRSDVVQVLDNGVRIAVSRQPHDQGSFTQSAERTYYIVPPGMSVIFRDEYGNELKRVGDFSGTDDPDMYDEAPIELTDRHGRTVYKTGGDYIDDASGVSDGTSRLKVVHLGQYVSNASGNGSVTSRSSSPLTVSLDRQGHHRRIHLEHSEDGSFGGSQGTERSLSPDPHSNHPQPITGLGLREKVTLRTIYP